MPSPEEGPHTPPLSERMRSVQRSPTAAFFERALALKQSGREVLSFTVGEPDRGTPVHIVEAARRALSEGATRYTPTRGLPALREAICADSTSRRGGVTHRPDQVVVSVGAKHTLFNLALALLGPGDEVIVPSPCWVSYPDQCRLAGATPVIVPTTADEGFKLTPTQLAEATNDRTRALILCTPSNPTGAAYSRQELAALAEQARAHNYWIIVDEIYAELVYGGFEQASLLEVAPDLAHRLLIVDGVSKRYAMTGFRLGWLLGPPQVAEACERVQSQGTTNATTVSQHAALAALTGPQQCVEDMRGELEARRNWVVPALNAIDGVQCRRPEGAFYAFFDVRGLYGREVAGRHVNSDTDVVEALLDEANVALVPGAGFMAPGFARLSYAAADEVLREGLSRIASTLGG